MIFKSSLRVVRSAISGASRFWRFDEPLVDLGGDERNTILVAGSARSGTTWIGNVIAEMTLSRTIFEPFLLNRSGDFLTPRKPLREAELCRNHQLYIPRASGDLSEYRKPIEAILRGRGRSSWPNMHAGTFAFGRRVIKEVRANLFLGYLADTWPQLRIVWIVRNPMSVVNSQIAMTRRKWSFDWDSQTVTSQGPLMEDWLHPFLPMLLSATSLAERLLHRWCIETYVPFHQRLQDLPNVRLVRYEDIVSDRSAWRELAYFIAGKDWSGPRFQEQLCSPSATSRCRARTFPADGNEHEHLCETDRAAISRIVDCYGLSEFCETR